MIGVLEGVAKQGRPWWSLLKMLKRWSFSYFGCEQIAYICTLLQWRLLALWSHQGDVGEHCYSYWCVKWSAKISVANLSKLLWLTWYLQNVSLLIKTTQRWSMVLVKKKSKLVLLKSKHKLKKQLLTTIKKKLKERLAKLSGGVCCCSRWSTFWKLKWKRKSSCRGCIECNSCGVEEGIVAGGGTAATCFSKIDKSKYSEERAMGCNDHSSCLWRTIRQIAFNAGLDGAIVLDRVLSNKSRNYGFNAYSDQLHRDLLKDGVIDPMKVVRCALQNAASVSSLMLTTETMIAEAPKKMIKLLGGAPGMGSMGWYGWHGRHDVIHWSQTHLSIFIETPDCLQPGFLTNFVDPQ